ncbi:MAG: sigma-54-dependent Fis family transcriptional regulator [Deltaproteobacteria bacterium]|nr:sigma-54-dependent Fis family transcriptional regulator [Deltaproteobacteria bacterium]
MIEAGPTGGGQSAKGRVLVVDDERTVCISCKRILEDEGYSVEFTLSGAEGARKAAEGQWDIVLLDLKMPDLPGMEALERIHTERPETVIIIITGYATIQTSIEAIKKGAFDYIPKPFTPEELMLSVTKALEDRRLRSENEYLKEELYRVRRASPVIGRSRAMEEITNQVLKIAPTDFTVMICGESGTGKEIIAHAVHENSLRREKPFVAVDISALTPTLVESELFGHVRGAFTGAVRNRPGYFSIARGGTLFLDEIANIGYDLQGKLLRVLETRRVRPVGSDNESECDIRLITATNQDLYRLVEEGKFREDLYYRLSVIPITVPPLRNRAEDIPLLTMHFLELASGAAGGRTKGFTTEAMAKLVSYQWPGNVRELKNIVERLVGTVDSDLIGIEHLPREISGVNPHQVELGIGPVPDNVEELKESKRQLKDKVYEQIERAFVLSALDKSGWNITQASLAVGMQRPNFHALMRKYGIRKGE